MLLKLFPSFLWSVYTWTLKFNKRSETEESQFIEWINVNKFLRNYYMPATVLGAGVNKKWDKICP